MLRMIFAAAIALALSSALVSTNAEARQRVAGLHPDCNVTMPCETRGAAAVKTRAERRPTRVAARSIPLPRERPVMTALPRTIAGYVHDVVTAPVRAVASAISLRGVVPELAAKARQIQDACGSKVVSAVRHTNIRGTRRLSLHAAGEAVDMVGNPTCIYANLRGWRGGYSTDYGRARHVHISLSERSGREMGVRFVHGGGRSVRRARYATAVRE